MENILIAESNKDIGLVLTRFFTGRGYTSKTINNGADALEELGKQQFNLLLCNCKLNDMTAIEFLQRLKQQNLEGKLPVIIMGCCDVNDAVDVMKFGASDCIPNPLYPEKVWEKVQVALNTLDNNQITARADTKESTINRTTELLPLPQDSDNYFESNCKEYIDVMKQVDLVSPTNFSVIIYGESGSGKEVIAQLIHNKSNRRDKPFVAIDCGALSKELAGSELFGHEKGSFTGALFQKIGSFEMANGGTIFLDEIANLSYDIQISLLRVVQERKMKRLGSNKDIPLDVRIIVASNEKLWSANKENKFREDLYHRFNEFSINLPPLRERKDDILPFANHFLAKINKELGKTIRGFTEEVERIFTEYIWHGNLRELKNVLKRAALLSEEQYIDIHNLPTELLKHRLETSTLGLCEKADNIYYSGLQDAKADAQGEIILNALKQTNNNKSKAAKLLNIDRKTLYNKLTQYNSFNTNKTAG